MATATANPKQQTAKQPTDVEVAQAKLNELKAEHAATRERLANLTPKTSIEADAVALLNGRRNDSTAKREEREQLSRNLHVLDEAIRMQERIVRQEQARENERHREANRPEHAALLLDLRDTLKAAEAAAAKLERFYVRTDNLVDRTMRFHQFGEFDPQTNRFENVARWEDEGNEFDCFKG